jgi:TIR domain
MRRFYACSFFQQTTFVFFPCQARLPRGYNGSGMRPWLDEVNIEPGADWDESIRNAIKDSHILLAILSKTSTAKTGYVQKEIRFALDRADEMPEGRVYIIPVLLEQCEIPNRLSRWQAVRLYQPEGETRLFSALRKRAAQIAGTHVERFI